MVVAGSFVVASGEGFVLLEPVEAAFDDVAAPVGGAVEAAECLAASSAPLIWSVRSGMVHAMPRFRR